MARAGPKVPNAGILVLAPVVCRGQIMSTPERECIFAATAGGNVVMMWDIAATQCDVVLGVRERDVRSWYSTYLQVCSHGRGALVRLLAGAHNARGFADGPPR